MSGTYCAAQAPLGGPGASRRAMLTAAAMAGAAALAAGAVPGIAGQDAGRDDELIALCGEIEALQAEADRIYFAAGPPSFDEERPRLVAIEPLRHRQDEIIEKACELGTHTTAGVFARVRALAAWSPELISEPPQGFGDAMLAALLRDAISGDVR